MTDNPTDTNDYTHAAPLSDIARKGEEAKAALRNAAEGLGSSGRTVTSPKLDVPGYEHLARILALAYDQSARGKGKERHGNGLAFDKQPIMEIARMSGLGGHIYQMMKKAQEAGTMHMNGYHDAAIKEFYGVMVYAAAAVKLIEEQRK